MVLLILSYNIGIGNWDASQREPEPFPMACCDVCNSKLTYSRADVVPRLETSTYCRMRHTGENAKECRFEHMPQIEIEEMRQQITEACNRLL